MIMGLMEKALQFKKEMNSRGKETLIDKIQGPAETEFMEVKTESGEMNSESVPALTDKIGESLDKILGPDSLQEIKIDDELFTLPDEEPAKIPETAGRSPELEAGANNNSVADMPDEIPAPEVQADIDESGPLGPEDEPVELFKSGKASASSGIPEISKDEITAAQKTAERTEQGGRQNKKFHDFMVLYEIGKEIVKAESRKQLYDVILFSIMGQIGASSSSILIPDQDRANRWIVADFRGITVKNNEMFFNTSAGILSNVLRKREIIDLEEYKDQAEYREEYFEFVSIDVRLLSPLSYDGRVLGAIGLGEKITIGDYSEAEKDFILSICEIAAVALNKINMIESIGRDLKKNDLDLKMHCRIAAFQERLVQLSELTEIKDILQNEFGEMGILSYAVFLRDERVDAFMPEIVEKEDFLSLSESQFKISINNPMIGYLSELKSGAAVENFYTLEPIRAAFSDIQLKKASVMWLYQYRKSDRLDAFMIVFRFETEDAEDTIRQYLGKMLTMLLPYLSGVRNQYSVKKRYQDNVEQVLKKLSLALVHAKNLSIPFTLVLFSIKNYKRYYNLYGQEEAKQLIDQCESVIISRLSDSDFAVRMDRNKFILALPGKNKKFAVPLANTIRNEIAQTFKKKEMQLMLVYLTAEYPEDGDDLYSLLDSIE